MFFSGPSPQRCTPDQGGDESRQSRSTSSEQRGDRIGRVCVRILQRHRIHIVHTSSGLSQFFIFIFLQLLPHMQELFLCDSSFSKSSLRSFANTDRRCGVLVSAAWNCDLHRMVTKVLARPLGRHNAEFDESQPLGRWRKSAANVEAWGQSPKDTP